MIATNTNSTEISPLRAGRQECLRLTRFHAKTFYFASHLLSERVRRNAFSVYAFCRMADEAVDAAKSREEAATNLDGVSALLEEIFRREELPPMCLAFRETLVECGIPLEPFRELLLGMRMDLEKTRYETYEELDLYCHRAAGVVGVMMAYVFGFKDARCLPRAVDLGKAMQLTNILRDIREDLCLGRVYLPREELERFQVTEAQLADGRVDENFRRLMRFQISRARALYESAGAGVCDLKGARNRACTRVMSGLYGEILSSIERQAYDVFRERARVSRGRKLAGLLRALVAGG